MGLLYLYYRRNEILIGLCMMEFLRFFCRFPVPANAGFLHDRRHARRGRKSPYMSALLDGVYCSLNHLTLRLPD